MRINFDFMDLEAFLAVYDTSSFHLASQRLGLSQSSVTRRLQKLEAELDVVLFHRTTRDVRPTLAAKRLKVRADAILSETRQTARAMRDESTAFAHQMSQTLTIAAVPTVVSRLVVPALLRLKQGTPSARFRILDTTANGVADAVAQGDADIGVGSVPAFEPAITFDLLFEEQMVLALPTDHPLAEKPVVSWRDLSDADLIVPDRGTGNRMLIDDALARTGVPLMWTAEVTRTTTALELVAAGVGVAPVPNSAMTDAQPARVTMRPIKSPVIARPIGLLTRIGDAGRPLSRQFAETARRVAATGIPASPPDAG